LWDVAQPFRAAAFAGLKPCATFDAPTHAAVPWHSVGPYEITGAIGAGGMVINWQAGLKN